MVLVSKMLKVLVAVRIFKKCILTVDFLSSVRFYSRKLRGYDIA